MLQFIKNLKARLERYSQVKATIKELSSLTDKELRDIGIGRGEIRSIAEESFPINSNLKGWV